MSKRKTGSHTVEELEIKDTVAYNTAVQHDPAKIHQSVGFSKGAHQKGPTAQRGGDVLERKRK